MSRVLHRDPAYQVVRALTVCRLAVGMFLPLCGLNDWWRLAAFLFVGAFVTDMLDGAAARSWGVASAAGARLDSRADAVLTAGALLAVMFGGVWHWSLVLAIMAIAAAALWWAEPRWRGDALGVLIVLLPCANLVLIAVLAAQFVQLAGGNFSTALAIEVGVAAVLALLKHRRIGDYLRTAIERAQD